MRARSAVIRDVIVLLAGSMLVFALDVLSPATLFASVAYPGLVLFLVRPGRLRLGVLAATLATVLIPIALALRGELSFSLSDPLVSAALVITLCWMIALLGGVRSAQGARVGVQISQESAGVSAVDLKSHANVVKLTEVQRALLDRMNLATQTAGLAVWDRDLIANTVYFDDSFARLFGLKSTNGSFEDLRRAIHPDDRQKVESDRALVLNDPNAPSVVTDRFRIVRETDGAVRHIQIFHRIFRNQAGGAERMVCVASDVTDEVKASQALIDATAAAQAANRAKSALLANVSHEIRTPMNGIIGMSALLLDGQLSPSQRECAETIRGSADSLLRVIDDILDFSKIEAGRMDVESIPTDLRRTVEEVRSLMSFQANQKQLAFTVDVAPDLSPHVMTDPQRLRQCLVNLVGNAIKFTASGSVKLSVSVVARERDHVVTRFEVRDTGIGIEPTNLKRLFEPFVQADSSTTRTFGGTGLGLSIVKRFVEMMDGSVFVQSTPGSGSTFWFDLPLVAAADTQPLEAPAKQAGRGEVGGFNARYKGRVLIVEDNLVNQKVARRILERLGCEVVVANDGSEALARHEADAFQLILMDMQMPVMDGLTATALIRQREQGRRRTPIVAFTANAMSREYERCMAVGMDAFLTKPLNVDRLCDLMNGFGMRDLSAGQRVPTEVAVAQDNEVEAMPIADPPVDFAKLDDLTGGDAEFTAELLTTFFASAEQSLDEMQRCLAQADRKQLGRVGHRLKGAAANVHADAVARASAAVEQEAATADPAHLQEMIAALRELLAQVADFAARERPSTNRAA